jgi:hypothetical protein
MRFSHKDFFSSEQVYHGSDQQFYRSKIKLNTGSRRCVEYVHVTTMYVPRARRFARPTCPYLSVFVRCARCARIVRPSVARVCERAPVRNKKTEPKEREEKTQEPKSRSPQPPTQTKPTQTKSRAPRPIPETPQLSRSSLLDLVATPQKLIARPLKDPPATQRHEKKSFLKWSKLLQPCPKMRTLGAKAPRTLNLERVKKWKP